MRNRSAKHVLRELAMRAMAHNPTIFGMKRRPSEWDKPGYFYEKLVSEEDKELLKGLKSVDNLLDHPFHFPLNR